MAFKRISGDFTQNFHCLLHRVEECEGPPNIEVEFQFEVLAVDGSTLTTSNVGKLYFKKGGSSSGVHYEINKSTSLPDGKLTVRCTMTKSTGYMETTTCFARTIVGVKRRSFNWKFSYHNLLKAERFTNRIKPASEDEIDITLHLSVCREESCDNMNIALVDDFRTSTRVIFKYALFDASGKSLKCGEEKYYFFNVDNEWAFQLLSLEKEQSEKISSLPNDYLTLQCECAYATKITHQQIENICQSQDSLRSQEHLHSSVTENALSEPFNTLKNHLSSLYKVKKWSTGLNLLMVCASSIASNGKRRNSMKIVMAYIRIYRAA
ncbi:speckle-type POZ protein-like A [Caerostris darwini]|uniref:Speckle-type POZ protein-like A n=1 Tax=Caerostris darwini TaxID=1538125 RepID=A0AAV4T4K5_9ARAC|nr:speckle-type POZ protein-like A [Caerostris darwini]